jgi:para-aminobenzoate synthetase component 1
MHITPCASPWEPEAVARRLAQRPGLAWLDGGLSHGREGRFSFVGSDPCELREQRVTSQRPLAELACLRAANEPADGAISPVGPLPRETPLWVGYVAYDAAWAGASRSRHVRGAEQAVLRFARHDAWFAYDHQHGQGFLLGDDAEASARLLARIESGRDDNEALAFTAGPISVTDPDVHRRAIVAALEHIREGNVYEINLARRFAAWFRGSPLGLYLRMREASPVPLGCFMAAGDHALLGRSMERFLRYERHSGALWTSPIKGTIARTGNDEGEARALKADPKEHAEHAMVVDLMRNDLSRVCEMGSVEVRELMAVLPFRDLSHLVSTVAGRARADLTLDELFEGTFPPGSVSGTPKLRALQIIDELESEPRGVYTGAYGFVDREGGCSFAVAIRTAVVRHGIVEYFAGGGIVSASDPERETAETELKARAFLRALHGA